MFTDPAVAGSWPALVDRLDRSQRPAQWATTAPALKGLTSTGEIPVLVAEHAHPAQADAVLGALVRLAAADGSDDPDASLVLLHLLSGGVHNLAAKLAHLTDNNIVTVVVGELICQIRRYPWRRRTRAYASNLLLDTKQALLRGELRPRRPGSVAVIPVDPFDLASWRSETPLSADDDVDVIDMLRWAGEQGIAPMEDLLILLELESERGYGNSICYRVADNVGVSERTIRRRRHRVLTALRRAKNEYLASAA